MLQPLIQTFLSIPSQVPKKKRDQRAKQNEQTQQQQCGCSHFSTPSPSRGFRRFARKPTCAQVKRETDPVPITANGLQIVSIVTAIITITASGVLAAMVAVFSWRPA